MNASVAIIGNPNVGKTEVFNGLTGLHHTTGNYPGVTVERKHGYIRDDRGTIEVVDLPGTYSLAARTPDEMIVADVLWGQQAGEQPIDAIVAVVDASSLERNLYLISQLLELGKPIVLVLNMMDIAIRRGLVIDIEALEAKLGVSAVPVVAIRREGLDQLRDKIWEAVTARRIALGAMPEFGEKLTIEVKALAESLLHREADIGRHVTQQEAFRILVDDGGYAERRLGKELGPDFQKQVSELRNSARTNGSLAQDEARARYRWVQDVLQAAVSTPRGRIASRSERIDFLLTHRIWGTLIFVVLMVGIFQSIYSWAAPLMNLIDGFVGLAGLAIGGMLSEGVLQSLIVDGIIGGVGAVAVFLPQILILTLFIALLEDCGYMARAAFLMDRLFHWCGLSGHSFIPMLSSFACAIPGIMATRTIEHRRDRLATILLAPLMSCSARLPVYVLMIAAFVPSYKIAGGLLNVQGLTLMAMYALGVIFAIPLAWLFKSTILRGETPPFLLEMPSYKMPRFRTVLHKVYLQAHEFVVRAGTIIVAITIIVWALAYFPHPDAIAAQFSADRQAIEATFPEGSDRDAALVSLEAKISGAYLEASILARAGKFVEPVVRPMGWDWRIGTAAIASFPAREIIVATLGTLFKIGGDHDETSKSLQATLQAATWPDGRKLFTIPTALSIMVFFALCCQCGATLAMIKRETGQWRWPVLTFTYMTILAYVASIATYQGAVFLGMGGA